MAIMQTIVDNFILIVGITPPKPEKKRGATIFIGTALVATVVGLVGLIAFLITRLIHH